MARIIDLLQHILVCLFFSKRTVVKYIIAVRLLVLQASIFTPSTRPASFSPFITFTLLYIKNLMQDICIVSICATYWQRYNVISAPPSVHLDFFIYYVSIRALRHTGWAGYSQNDRMKEALLQHSNNKPSTNLWRPIVQPEFSQNVKMAGNESATAA